MKPKSFAWPAPASLRHASVAAALAVLLLVALPARAAEPKLGTLAKFPPDVLLVVGISSLDALAAGLDDVQASLGLPPSGNTLKPALLDALGVTSVDAAAIDGSRPVTLALLDPKKHEHPLALVLPLVENRAQLRVNGPLGTPLSPTADKALKALAAWKPQAHVTFEAALAQASDTYAAEVATMRSLLYGLMVKELADPAQRADTQQGIDALGDMIETLSGTERLGLAVDLSGGAFSVALGITPRAGTTLAKTTKELKAKKVGNGGLVPDDAWLASGWHLPASVMGDDSAEIIGTLVTLIDQGLEPSVWTQAEIADLTRYFKSLQVAQSNPSVMWARSSPAGAIFLETLSDVKDGGRYFGDFIAFGELAFANAMEAMRKKLAQQGQDPNALPQMTFREFVGFTSSVALTSMGMGMRVEESKTAKGSDIAGMSIDVQWDKVPGVDPNARMMAQRFVGSSIQLAVAGEGKWLAGVFGPSAASSVAALLAEAPARAKAKARDPILERLAQGSIYFIVRPQAALHALMELPPSGPEEPLTLRTVSDGKRITTVLDIPASTFRLIGAFR